MNPHFGAWKQDTACVSRFRRLVSLLLLVFYSKAFCQADFTLEVTPANQTVTLPDTAFYEVSVGSALGYSDPVTLSVSGQPSGTVATFDPNPVAPLTTSLLTIANTLAASAGEYPLQITAVAATSTHTADVVLRLEGAPSSYADFFIVVSPPEVSACAGNSADYEVTVGSQLGFNDPVTLSAMGQPAGTNLSFNPNPVFPPGSSSMTISNTAVAVAGDYSVGVVAVAPTSTHYATGTLRIFDTPPDLPTLLTPPHESENVASIPVLQWSAASRADRYLVEVAGDPTFSTVLYSAWTKSVTHTMRTALPPQSLRYWRVTAQNPCGAGGAAPPFSFTTGGESCRVSAIPIGDNEPTGVEDYLQVSESGVLAGLEVRLHADHTFMGDLIFSLEHLETGTEVVLIDRPGVPLQQFGCPGNGIDVLLTDSGATSVEEVCSTTGTALSGILIPQEPLQAFVGEDLQGTWILKVSDNAIGDIGSLAEWCLLPTFETSTPTPTESPTSPPTSTPTPTHSPTATSTNSPTHTETWTPIPTSSPTPTISIPPSPTNSPSTTPSPTATGTNSPTATGTSTPTPSPTKACDYDIAPLGGDGRLDAKDLLELLRTGVDPDTLIQFARCWHATP